MKKIAYYVSERTVRGRPGSKVSLWRSEDGIPYQIAKFNDDISARKFVEDFDFPLHDELKARLYGKVTET